MGHAFILSGQQKAGSDESRTRDELVALAPPSEYPLDARSAPFDRRLPRVRLEPGTGEVDWFSGVRRARFFTGV